MARIQSGRGTRGEPTPWALFIEAHAGEGSAADDRAKGRQEGPSLLFHEEAPRILEATEVRDARFEPPTEKMVSSLSFEALMTTCPTVKAPEEEQIFSSASASIERKS